MTSSMTALLEDIFGSDFSHLREDAAFIQRFFERPLNLDDLRKVHSFLAASDTLQIPGISLVGKKKAEDLPFVVMSQIHGNEPAGLAGILLVMALSEAGFLQKSVYLAIGNLIASTQYFEALAGHPNTPQESHDVYRTGLDSIGNPLRDLNRMPPIFMQMDATNDPSMARAQLLYRLGQRSSGLLDIHTARGNMVVITDHTNDQHLLYSPIRQILTNLLASISSATSTLTLKQCWEHLPNIESKTGIEAGRHEAPEAPYIAAEFTLSLLYNLGISTLKPPRLSTENGVFSRITVGNKLAFRDLVPDTNQDLLQGEMLYPVKPIRDLSDIPPGTEKLLVENNGKLSLQSAAAPYGTPRYAVYQFEELEPIAADQIVMVAVPSGITFRAPHTFLPLFVTKSAEKYSDPAVGPWPVSPERMGEKFAYPCKARKYLIQA